MDANSCVIVAARIKRNRNTQQIKFKVRCQRFVYTLVLKDSDKADKLKQSLPPGALPFSINRLRYSSAVEWDERKLLR